MALPFVPVDDRCTQSEPRQQIDDTSRRWVVHHGVGKSCILPIGNYSDLKLWLPDFKKEIGSILLQPATTKRTLSDCVANGKCLLSRGGFHFSFSHDICGSWITSLYGSETAGAPSIRAAKKTRLASRFPARPAAQTVSVGNARGGKKGGRSGNLSVSSFG